MNILNLNEFMFSIAAAFFFFHAASSARTILLMTKSNRTNHSHAVVNIHNHTAGNCQVEKQQYGSRNFSHKLKGNMSQPQMEMIN